MQSGHAKESSPPAQLRRRLKQLGHEGKFSNLAAAQRVGPERAPGLFHIGGDGEPTVNARRLSDQLAPGGTKTPMWVLVEAFAELHAERLGIDPAPQLADLKILHHAAVEYARRDKSATEPAASDAQRVGAASVAGALVRPGREMTVMREEFARVRVLMEAQRRGFAEELRRVVAALEMKTAEQFSLVRGQMGEMRAQFDEALAAAKADNARLDARIEELELAVATHDGVVEHAVEHALQLLHEEMTAQRESSAEQALRLAAVEHDNTVAWEKVAAMTEERDQFAERLATAEATAIRVTAKNDQLDAEIDTARRIADTHQVRQTPDPDSADSDHTDSAGAGATSSRFGRWWDVPPDPDRLFPNIAKREVKTVSVLGVFSAVSLVGTPLGFWAGSNLGDGWSTNVSVVVSMVFNLILLRSMSRIVNLRHPVEVFEQTLAVCGLFRDRFHSWDDIAKISIHDTGDRLDLDIQAADGTLLSHRDSALTTEEWDAFAEAVFRTAPHVEIARPPRTQPATA